MFGNQNSNMGNNPFQFHSGPSGASNETAEQKNSLMEGKMRMMQQYQNNRDNPNGGAGTQSPMGEHPGPSQHADGSQGKSNGGGMTDVGSVFGGQQGSGQGGAPQGMPTLKLRSLDDIQNMANETDATQVTLSEKELAAVTKVVAGLSASLSKDQKAFAKLEAKLKDGVSPSEAQFILF